MKKEFVIILAGILLSSSAVLAQADLIVKTVSHTGTLTASAFDAQDSHLYSRKYVTNLTNLKPTYLTNEIARLRVYTRPKNWQPNIYTVASNNIENTIIDNMFFKLLRISDNSVIVDYGTGSQNHTKLSYDDKGNFFDYDFSMLESGYAYAFRFLLNLDGTYEEVDNVFRFKIQ